MGFWKLLVFIHVVELKSFSEAAKVCKLSQPTVSSHIKQLESYLGCALVDRIGRQVVITRVGEVLYRYAKKLMALKEEAETAISLFKGELKGVINIGASTIPGVYILPELIAGFRKPYPNVRVCLEIDSSGTILQKISEGALELGVVGVKSGHKTLQQRRLVSDEMLLVVPPEHRWKKRDTISFETLRHEPFIKREESSGTWKTFRNCITQAGHEVDALNIVAEIGHSSGIISGIKNGLGISVLSSIAISDELKNNQLKALKIKGVNHQRDFYLTWNVHRSFSPVAGLLRDYIEERFGL